MGLFPEGLKALQQGAKAVGLDLRGAEVHRDGGCASTRKRTGMFNAGLRPNIKEHPRHRKTTKRGRQRVCNAAIQAGRRRGERTCAWADTCKRLLLRFERIQQRH